MGELFVGMAIGVLLMTGLGFLVDYLYNRKEAVYDFSGRYVRPDLDSPPQSRFDMMTPPVHDVARLYGLEVVDVAWQVDAQRRFEGAFTFRDADSADSRKHDRDLGSTNPGR